MKMRNKFANSDREVQCLALFAREAEGEEIMLRIAEVDEDIKIVVENPEGSIQYVLDDNNLFQVTEINEDNILNEIVDVLEKSELMKQDLSEQSPKNTDKNQVIDRFLHEIEDYNNNFIIEDVHESLAFVCGDFDDLCIYLQNCSDSVNVEPNNQVDKLQIATELPQSDIIETSNFKEWDNSKEHQILRDVGKENQQVSFCNDSADSNKDGGVNVGLKKKKKAKSKNLKAKLWKCTICDHLALNKSLLSQHKAAEHEFQQSTHRSSCLKCNASFKTQWELKSHNLKYHTVKNVVCPFCKQRFINKANLNEHIRCTRSHLTWRCAQCSKIFHNSFRFKSHLRFHKIRKYID